jgi:hypothetical protein
MRTLVAAETKFAHDHPDIGYTSVLSALPSEIQLNLFSVGKINIRSKSADVALKATTDP